MAILKCFGRSEQKVTQFPTILVSYQQKFRQILFGQIAMIKMLRCFDLLLQLEDSAPDLVRIRFHVLAIGASKLRVLSHFRHRGSAFLASEIESGTVFHLASSWEVMIASHTSTLKPIFEIIQKLKVYFKTY